MQSREHAAGGCAEGRYGWLAGEGSSARSHVEGGRRVAAKEAVRPQKLADGVEMGA